MTTSEDPGGSPKKPSGPRKKARIVNLKLIWSFATAYPRQISLAGIALVAAAAATLAIPAGFRLVIDRGFGSGGDTGDIGQWFRYLLMIVVVLAIATAVRFYFVTWIGERVVADLRKATQRNLLRLPPGFFEENRPSEIASRMTSDTAIIEQVLSNTVSIALRNVVLAVGGIIYLVYLAPQLTIGLLVAIPLVLVPVIVLARRVRSLSRRSQDRIADIGAMASETLSAMKIVQSFGQENREAKRFGDAVERGFETAKTRIRFRALMTALMISLMFGAITVLMWKGAIDVAEGRLSGGDIAAFVITGGLVAGAFAALSEVYGNLLRAAGAAERLSELIRAEPDIAPPARPLALPTTSRGQITFEKVRFRYPTRPDALALDDFSLNILPGETVALVGPSGAGKSTVLQLAQRFYDPESGVIKVDGVALTSADPAEIRSRMALVPQETTLFAASARDNLRYGNWDAPDEEIWAAARAANAQGFLTELPHELDTMLGEAGSRLSGGQRQRMAIARAILRKAPILLLDEATSALDSESEKLVQEALDGLMADRTTLVIAHRLSTVRAANRIIVMERGRIVEQGDHESLIAKGGLYARLASLQFQDIAA